jgi:hypothetical protein
LDSAVLDSRDTQSRWLFLVAYLLTSDLRDSVPAARLEVLLASYAEKLPRYFLMHLSK